MQLLRCWESQPLCAYKPYDNLVTTSLCEFQYVFNVLHRMNLRFDLSVDSKVVFGVPKNDRTFIVINYYFKVAA